MDNTRYPDPLKEVLPVQFGLQRYLSLSILHHNGTYSLEARRCLFQYREHSDLLYTICVLKFYHKFLWIAITKLCIIRGSFPPVKCFSTIYIFIYYIYTFALPNFNVLLVFWVHCTNNRIALSSDTKSLKVHLFLMHTDCFIFPL